MWRHVGLMAAMTVTAGCAAPERPELTTAAQIDAQRTYDCPHTRGAIVVDGRAGERDWSRAPWSTPFVDIEGAKRPLPRFETRMKMLWDDRFLYVYAELREPHVWGTLTEKNSVIYHDNDFEIFLDPDGDGLNYYEFEMNALGTIWELTLDKPYHDHGTPTLGTNLPGLKSAVRVDRTVNDPRDEDHGWSVEIAIPLSELAAIHVPGAGVPRAGDAWRIDFSRVEWTHHVVEGRYVKVPKESKPEDNWVWSPTGRIDMHRPERWGRVVFRN